MGPLWFLHLHPKEPITLPILSHAFVRSAHSVPNAGGQGAVLLITKSTPVVSLSEPSVCPMPPSSPFSKTSFFSLCIQSILITHSCKSWLLTKCICNPQINTQGTFVAILDMCKVLKKSDISQLK